MNLAQILNKLMAEHGNMSAYRLSKETGISDRLIGYWRNGEKLPGAENIIILAEYFGISADYLLGISDRQADCSNNELNRSQSIDTINQNINLINDSALKRLCDYSNDLAANPLNLISEI